MTLSNQNLESTNSSDSSILSEAQRFANSSVTSEVPTPPSFSLPSEENSSTQESLRRRNFRASYFFKWLLNNKVVTALAVLLLILLNVLLLSNLGFIFTPVADFLSAVGLPVVLAAVFYYLLNPLVDLLEKRKIPRLVTIALLFVILAALIVWGLAVVIPNIIDGISHFSKHVPHYVDVTQKEINSLLASPRFEQFRPQFDKMMSSLGNSLIDWSKNASVKAVSSLTDIVTKTTDVIISLVVFPFVLFFLLKDGGKFNSYLTNFLPTSWRKETSSVLTEVNGQLSAYVRGQVTVAVIVGILLAIGLPIIGLRYALALAILSGFFNLIPFLGFFLSIVPACIVGLATGGPWMLVKVIIIFAIEQTIESRVVSPLVLGSQLKIHPITIIFILLTAGKLFGVWGILLGIPTYAAIKVIATHFFAWYRNISELYPKEEVEE